MRIWGRNEILSPVCGCASSLLAKNNVSKGVSYSLKN